MTLVVEQFSVSTAEDQKNYFTGTEVERVEEPRPSIPEGTYRVVDGKLYRIVAGVAPFASGSRPGLAEAR